MGNDPVAISFWVISIAMVAATVSFLMESNAVGLHWKTSLNVGALVTLVAVVHYCPLADGGVLLDPLCGAAQHRCRHVLAPSGRHCLHVGGRLLRRGWHGERCVRLLRWHVWMGLHPLRDLRG